MRFLLATSNRHKAEEINAILRLWGVSKVELLTLEAFPEAAPPPETGRSFLENARLKARGVSKQVAEWVLADDSGLCVQALDGRPGVFSARYAGLEASDADRIARLLEELEGLPLERRGATFRCALALARFGRVFAETEAAWAGLIALAPAGEEGFGYDPVFLLPQFGQTVAQLGTEAKNRISHRSRAVRRLLPALWHWTQGQEPPVGF